MKPISRAFRRPAVSVLAAAVALLALLPLPGRAEDVNLSCLDGSHLSDADLARGTTVIVVWASWSPRSRDIAERVRGLAGRWGSRARVVAVSFQEERPGVARFAAGKSFGAPVCLDPDGTFSHKYNVATLPGLMVVKDGQVVHRGRLGDDADQILGDLLH
jgi:thiol-disulfide isomerase/thioredoxin